MSSTVADGGGLRLLDRSRTVGPALDRGNGARRQVVDLPIDPAEQRRRVTRRFAATPHWMFEMTDAELADRRNRFDVPDDDELCGSHIPALPAPYPT